MGDDIEMAGQINALQTILLTLWASHLLARNDPSQEAALLKKEWLETVTPAGGWNRLDSSRAAEVAAAAHRAVNKFGDQLLEACRKAGATTRT